MHATRNFSNEQHLPPCSKGREKSPGNVRISPRQRNVLLFRQWLFLYGYWELKQLRRLPRRQRAFKKKLFAEKVLREIDASYFKKRLVEQSFENLNTKKFLTSNRKYNDDSLRFTCNKMRATFCRPSVTGVVHLCRSTELQLVNYV